MKEKIILNGRKSKIALILVLIILMQISMLILTNTSKIYAVEDNTEELLTTITATGIEQASYSTEGIATVSFSSLPSTATATYGSSYIANWGWWGYGWTATVTPVDGCTITKCVFYNNNGVTATDNEAPFVVETTGEDKTPLVNGTPIQSNGSNGIKKIEVYGYASKTVTSTPTYTITIPSTLAVEKTGWNNLEGGIKAIGQNFSETQALSVTASSEHNWTLVSNNTTDTVGYNLASSNTSTYSSTATPATWEFSKSELETTNGTTKALGVVVEDYSSKKSGDYEDTVTFTASVVNNAIEVTGLTIDNAPTEALFVNSTGTLTATVLPNNATDKTVTWSSSDPDYVSINETTGEYEVKGTKGYGSATITATAGGKTATCTITGKVHHTSLQAGDVIRVGETIYTGATWRVNITPITSFAPSNGVITLVEAETNGTLYYKFSRGSNGTKPNWTKFKVQDNTDGIYIISGDGSTSNKFVFGVHNK